MTANNPSVDSPYAERDHAALDMAGNYYCRHVDAMTRFGLHSKSAIAGELAWRDARIAELERALTEPAGGEVERVATRSLFAWFIGMLALDLRDYAKPTVGDWVVEVTSLLDSRRDGLHWDTAIGQVVSVDGDSYVLRLPDGTSQRWENASMRKLPMARAALAAAGGKL